MKSTIRLFSFASPAMLVLSIGMVQAQMPAAPTHTSNRRRFDTSEFQFSNLTAKPRTIERSGFALGRRVAM
jgi:hypothetical protein